MRSALPAVSLIGLLGAGAGVGWSVWSRPADVYMTAETVDAFNLDAAPATPAMGEGLRDAVAAVSTPASSLMKPISDKEMVFGATTAEAVKPRSTVSPKAEVWAKKHALLTGLLAGPAQFLAARSAMGSPQALRAFLSDPKRVDGYMNSPLVRVTINSPTVAKAVLGNPAVVRAFLAAPAMSDPRAVRALMESPMLRKFLDCPGIQAALSDPGVIQRMITDPQTLRWIGEHPRALAAIGEAAPALSRALGARIR